MGNIMPAIAQIELTSVCNHKCKFCGHSSMSREKRHMKMSDFKKLVTILRKNKIRIVRLFSMGESSIHPNFLDALSLLKSNGFFVYIASNMTGITPDITDWIVNNFEREDLVVLDIDSVNRETYIDIKGVDTFDLAMTNIDYFIGQYFKNGALFECMAKMLLYHVNDTEEEKQAFLDKYERETEMNYSAQIFYPNNWAGKFESYGSTGHEADSSCTRLTRDIVVLNNGDVVLCCLDYDADVVLGNVFLNSICEIYNSPTINYYRKKFPVGMCRDCNERSRW